MERLKVTINILDSKVSYLGGEILLEANMLGNIRILKSNISNGGFSFTTEKIKTEKRTLNIDELKKRVSDLYVKGHSRKTLVEEYGEIAGDIIDDFIKNVIYTYDPKEKVINASIDTKEIKNYKTFHNDIERIVDKVIRKLDTIK